MLRVVAAIGASPAWYDRWTTLNRVTTGIEGGVFLLVVPGVLMVLRLPLVPRRMRESRLWVGAALIWLGSGALVGWGGGRTFSLAAEAHLSETLTLVERLTNLVAVLSGVALGVAALLFVTRAIDAANRPKARSDDGLRGARIE